MAETNVMDMDEEPVAGPSSKKIKVEKTDDSEDDTNNEASLSSNIISSALFAAVKREIDIDPIVFLDTNNIKTEIKNEPDETEGDTSIAPKEEIYQLKITLLRIKPFIWRRVQIPKTASFATLHYIIQKAMGWQDCHLHQFEKRLGQFSHFYLVPAEELEYFGEGNVKDESVIKVCEVLKKPKDSLFYLYDMGDGWLHNITLEASFVPEVVEGQINSFPKCIDGKRACPPEDVGGIGGYENLLDVLKNPADEQYTELTQWLNDVGYENYDPEKFDISSVIF